MKKLQHIYKKRSKKMADKDLIQKLESVACKLHESGMIIDYRYVCEAIGVLRQVREDAKSMYRCLTEK